MESTLYKTSQLAMPKGVFWADPFLYRHKDQLYVFFENYSYKTKRGKISAGKIIESESKSKNGKYRVVDVCDALALDFHMSYPQIFEDGGEIFLMPETCQNKKLEIYRCVRFPDKWELYASAFDGEEIVDATYYRDSEDSKWLFVNKGRAPEAELRIYKIDGPKLKNITPHKLNPLLMDSKSARSGGALFTYQNEIYRPSQINTHGVYGKGLQISKITKLSLDEFETEAVISIEPNFKKGLVGLHHLHQYEGCFVFDACYKRL
jgi:hypothetical protein